MFLIFCKITITVAAFKTDLYHWWIKIIGALMISQENENHLKFKDPFCTTWTRRDISRFWLMFIWYPEGITFTGISQYLMKKERKNKIVGSSKLKQFWEICGVYIGNTYYRKNSLTFEHSVSWTLNKFCFGWYSWQTI